MTRRVRRVVTGADAAGRGAILADGAVEDALQIPGLEGWQLANVWSVERGTSVPFTTAGAQPPLGVPATGSVQFTMWHLPPEKVGENPAGMHATDSVDLIVVVSGEVTLVLDGGDEVTLRSGDTLVQGGNSHHWSNRSEAECVLAIVMVGATR